MKIKILSIIAAIMCSLSSLAIQPVRPPYNVTSGHFGYYTWFEPDGLEGRNVIVWLPEGYTTGEPCDVIYMHDGQMLFDAEVSWNKQEWQVDEVLGRLMAENKIRRCIVVGIENTKNRLNDYFPTRCYEKVPLNKRDSVDINMFKGDEYLRLIVEEVKPLIDVKYGPLTSREHTFIMGSSMGGLISLYALCNYPEVFGGAVCMSTHLSMNFFNPSFDSEAWAQGFREYVKEKLPAPNTALLYMDRGDVELDGTYGPYQDNMDEMIKGLGWDDKHYMSRVFEGHKHMETFWAERLDVPFMFFLKK